MQNYWVSLQFVSRVQGGIANYTVFSFGKKTQLLKKRFVTCTQRTREPTKLVWCEGIVALDWVQGLSLIFLINQHAREPEWIAYQRIRLEKNFWSKNRAFQSFSCQYTLIWLLLLLHVGGWMRKLGILSCKKAGESQTSKCNLAELTIINRN